MTPALWLSTASAAEEVPSETATQTPQTPAAQPAEATPEPSKAEVARARAEQRRAEMDAEREKRYAELRASAAQLGVELPETPPWQVAESSMPAMPTPPDMPAGYGRPSPEERKAMRQQREAMRAERWQRMQDEASERGMDMPQTPPWADAQKRHQDMAERFEAYRKTIEQMTDEQREAARAVFGRHPHAKPRPRMPQAGYGYPSRKHPCQDDAYDMPYPPMMPYYQEAPGYDQGPPPPPAKRQGD
ncbi:hypothetical protein CKO23_04020 [Thiocystis violacea]|nr:hypothetical protein [Thiocystis violacea]